MNEQPADKNMAARRNLVKYTAISMYFYLCYYLINPLLSPYIKSQGIGDIGLSLMMAVFPFSLILLSPAIGSLSDRYGRKRVVHGGFFAYTLSLAFYLAASPALVVLGRIFEAAALAAVIMVALARVQDSLSDESRGRLAGWNLSFNHLTVILAPVAGGILADRFRLVAPFLASFCLLLVFSLVLFFVRDEDDKARRENYRKNRSAGSVFNLPRQIQEFLSFRELKGMAILGATMHAASEATSVFLPLFIVEVMGLGYASIGIAIFAQGLTHLVQFYFGRLSDRYGARVVTLAGCLIVGLSTVLLSGVRGYPGLIAVLLLSGTGGAMWNVSAWSLMSAIGVKAEKEGQFVTSYISLAKIGAVLMGLVAGLIVAGFSIRFLFLVSGLLTLVGVAAAYSLLKTPRSLPSPSLKN